MIHRPFVLVYVKIVTLGETNKAMKTENIIANIFAIFAFVFIVFLIVSTISAYLNEAYAMEYKVQVIEKNNKTASATNTSSSSPFAEEVEDSLQRRIDNISGSITCNPVYFIMEQWLPNEFECYKI